MGIKFLLQIPSTQQKSDVLGEIKSNARVQVKVNFKGNLCTYVLQRFYFLKLSRLPCTESPDKVLQDQKVEGNVGERGGWVNSAQRTKSISFSICLFQNVEQRNSNLKILVFETASKIKFVLPFLKKYFILNEISFKVRITFAFIFL